MISRLDKGECVGRGSCERVCPVLSTSNVPLDTPPQVYVAWANDREDMRGRDRHSMFGSNPLLHLDFDNGRHANVLMDVDSYGKAFWGKLASRSSCHQCSFKTIGRSTDITMGDCWFSRQLTKDDNTPYEVTLCLTQSERGRKLLTACPDLGWAPVPTIEAIKANGGMIYSSSKAHPRREAFLAQLGTTPFGPLVQEHLPSGIGFKVWSVRRYLGRAIKSLFPRLLEQRSHTRQQREYERRMERTIPAEAFAVHSIQRTKEMHTE